MPNNYNETSDESLRITKNFKLQTENQRRDEVTTRDGRCRQCHVDNVTPTMSRLQSHADNVTPMRRQYHVENVANVTSVIDITFLLS